MDLPHVHAGAVYYNMQSPAGPVLARFRSNTEHAFENYDRLGFKSLFRQKSKVLEILYSYAFAKAGFTPLDFYEHPAGGAVRTTSRPTLDQR